MVSIIMPAYNAEKYIESSVKSILNQTYKDIELIVVNDGSTDRTASVVEMLAANDKRVHLITKSNGGPADARNTALDSLSEFAEYVMFCDADDEFIPTTVERALEKASSGADIIFCGFTIVNPDGTRNNYSEPDVFIRTESFGDVFSSLYKANLLNQVWAKLISTKIIRDNNIRFPLYKWGEDRFFIFDCIEASHSICVDSECIYLYKMHKGDSLISSFYDRKIDVCIEIDKRVETLRRKYGIEDDGYFRYMFIKSIFSSFTNLYTPSCKLSRKEKRQYIKKALSNEYIRSNLDGCSGGFAISVISRIMKSRIVTLNILVANCAKLFGKIAPKIFQKIKHKK